MKVEIKNRWSGKVLHKVEAESLRDAVIRLAANRANLSGADLSDADLSDADLSDADLSDAVSVNREGAIEEELTPEQYAQRAQEYRERWPDVPVVPLLDATVCKIVNSGEGGLEMGDWHACETTHCRAGWAIHLAGDAGYALEEKYGPERAGAMIYKASTGRYPDFFASNEEALADICKWGGIETAAQGV